MYVKILIHVHWCVFKGCWRPSVHCSPKRHFFVNMPSWNSEEETEANCVQHVSMRLNKGHYQKCKNLIFSLYSRVARQNLNNADHYNIKGSHYPKNVTNCTIFFQTLTNPNFKVYSEYTEYTLSKPPLVQSTSIFTHSWRWTWCEVTKWNDAQRSLSKVTEPSTWGSSWGQVQTVLAGFRALSVKHTSYFESPDHYFGAKEATQNPKKQMKSDFGP